MYCIKFVRTAVRVVLYSRCSNNWSNNWWFVSNQSNFEPILALAALGNFFASKNCCWNFTCKLIQSWRIRKWAHFRGFVLNLFFFWFFEKMMQNRVMVRNPEWDFHSDFVPWCKIWNNKKIAQLIFILRAIVRQFFAGKIWLSLIFRTIANCRTIEQ